MCPCGFWPPSLPLWGFYARISSWPVWTGRLVTAWKSSYEHTGVSRQLWKFVKLSFKLIYFGSAMDFFGFLRFNPLFLDHLSGQGHHPSEHADRWPFSTEQPLHPDWTWKQLLRRNGQSSSNITLQRNADVFYNHVVEMTSFAEAVTHTSPCWYHRLTLFYEWRM